MEMAEVWALRASPESMGVDTGRIRGQGGETRAPGVGAFGQLSVQILHPVPSWGQLGLC